MKRAVFLLLAVMLSICIFPVISFGNVISNTSQDVTTEALSTAGVESHMITVGQYVDIPVSGYPIITSGMGYVKTQYYPAGYVRVTGLKAGTVSVNITANRNFTIHYFYVMDKAPSFELSHLYYAIDEEPSYNEIIGLSKMIFNWNSSNPSVAKVDDEGMVTPLSSGRTVITASNEMTSLSYTVDVIKMPNYYAQITSVNKKKKFVKIKYINNSSDSLVINNKSATLWYTYKGKEKGKNLKASSITLNPNGTKTVKYSIKGKKIGTSMKNTYVYYEIEYGDSKYDAWAYTKKKESTFDMGNEEYYYTYYKAR